MNISKRKQKKEKKLKKIDYSPDQMDLERDNWFVRNWKWIFGGTAVVGGVIAYGLHEHNKVVNNLNNDNSNLLDQNKNLTDENQALRDGWAQTNATYAQQYSNLSAELNNTIVTYNNILANYSLGWNASNNSYLFDIQQLKDAWAISNKSYEDQISNLTKQYQDLMNQLNITHSFDMQNLTNYYDNLLNFLNETREYKKLSINDTATIDDLYNSRDSVNKTVLMDWNQYNQSKSQNKIAGFNISIPKTPSGETLYNVKSIATWLLKDDTGALYERDVLIDTRLAEDMESYLG